MLIMKKKFENFLEKVDHYKSNTQNKGYKKPYNTYQKNRGYGNLKRDYYPIEYIEKIWLLNRKSNTILNNSFF